MRIETVRSHQPERKDTEVIPTITLVSRKMGLKEKEAHQKMLKKALIIGAAAVGTALAVCGAYKLAKSGKLDGLIEIGKSTIQNTIFAEPEDSDRASQRKRMADYERWAKANDARIRNHGRL